MKGTARFPLTQSAAALVLCAFVCSCNKPGLLPSQRRGTGDLAVFVFSEFTNYGGAQPLTVRSVIGITNYVYSMDKDGFQVICPGNKVGVIRSMFQQPFGDPAVCGSNESGVASFVYSGQQTGVAIECGLDAALSNGSTQQVTHLVIVRPAALK